MKGRPVGKQLIKGAAVIGLLCSAAVIAQLSLLRGNDCGVLFGGAAYRSERLDGKAALSVEVRIFNASLASRSVFVYPRYTCFAKDPAPPSFVLLPFESRSIVREFLTSGRPSLRDESSLFISVRAGTAEAHRVYRLPKGHYTYLHGDEE